MTGKIDISPPELTIVQGILKDHLPNGTLAWAFGSRVTWTAKPFSDLDIALEGATPLPSDVLIDLEESFESSDLPWKVDVIDLNAVSPEFRLIVKRQRVPADWEYLTLGEVAHRGGGSVQTGPFGSQLHASDYKERGVPVIMPQNLSTDRISTDGIARISEEDAERLSKHRVQVGDIVYSRRGDVERRALVRPENEGWLCGTGCLKVRLGAGVLVPEFAAFYLSHPASKAWVVQHAVGATMPNLNTSILSAVPFVLPPLDEQERIADTLSAVDDKIELNRRMNQTLEAMARAVFRDWFVDFGPTRRNAAGLTDPAAILGGLLTDPEKAAPLAALFPSSFGDNGLPEGWEFERLDRYLELAYGKALTKKDRIEGDYPVYGSGGISGSHNAPLANGPAIIVGRKGTVGSLYWEDRDFFAIDTVFYVVPKTRLSFLFYMLETLGLELMNTDAAVPGLNRNNVYRLERAFGCEATRNAFADLADQFKAVILNNEKEIQTLAATRDLLLSKLMSGEIRLTGAEGVV